MLETVVQDLRLGTRMLVKNPGFALVAILSIAIGVGPPGPTCANAKGAQRSVATREERKGPSERVTPLFCLISPPSI